MYYAYILRSIKNPKEVYSGYTTDIKERLNHHNSGSSPHTAKNKPWEIEFLAVFKRKKLAIEFERYLKSSSGKAFRNKRLISHELYDNLQSSEDS